ncbi:hypothetical protein ASG43_21460 [Aureimonas sp. Leaf454]|uniref:hypothetical protein n=1 Tax=Aureimonas sp. Leaf454 TaxID=1736381 RepID=UPI0006FEADC3|nr:hypothetical protein [Aureimonas sp. Leaf454]KQT51175.1 hypothetical protein ASG43_21460 [Aureimonas sp. Leaf454]
MLHALLDRVRSTPREGLTRVLTDAWVLSADGKLNDDEAAEVERAVRARQQPGARREVIGRRGPSRRTEEQRAGALARRRLLAASGALPPDVAARFSVAEQAVLMVVAVEVARRGDCRMSVGELSARAGCSQRSAQNAVRKAASAGLISVEARKVARRRNDTNVLRVIDRAWRRWLDPWRAEGWVQTNARQDQTHIPRRRSTRLSPWNPEPVTKIGRDQEAKPWERRDRN